MPICSRQNWIFLSKNLGLVLDLNGRISFFAGPTVNHVKSPCFVGIKIIFFAGSIPLQALASPPRYRVRSRAARGVRNKRCCTSWRTPETWRGTWHERQEDGRIHWDYGFSQEFWCLMTIPLGFTSYLPSNFHVWWQLIVIYKKKHEQNYWLENMNYFMLFSNMEMGWWFPMTCICFWEVETTTKSQ